MDETAKRAGARVARHVVAAALAAGAAIAAPNAVAASDMYLSIKGITGESADSKHKGEIDVLAWSWGLGPKASPGQKAGSNSTCAQQLAFTKYVDSATPQLITNAVLGATSSEATLTVWKSGEPPFEYLRVTLKNVTVSSLSTGGSDVGDRLTENVTLGFASATVTYTPQDKDGTAGTAVKATVPGSCP